MAAESTPDPGTPGESGTTKGRGSAGRRSGRRKALLAAVWTVVGIVVLGGSGVGYLYFRLNGNLRSIDLNSLLGHDRPENVDNGSQDILVLGSDSRSGGNGKLGGGKDDGTARADTAMIVHVYEGHRKAVVVSVPRDTLVDRPGCTGADGDTHPAETDAMFNSAFALGGAACAVRTVESMTGIRMDHYVEVDFSGFEELVDELGGVPITTTEDIDDPRSHLDLEAGRHTLDGRQSLGLVRTRHGVGDGSDLGRIQLQQAYLKALADRVADVGVLSSPKKLYDLADTATRAVTTDSELGSVRDLATFADGLKGIGSDRMTMVTMPVRDDPADPNRVLVDDEPAGRLWAALRADRAVPQSATEGTAQGAADGVVGTGRPRTE